MGSSERGMGKFRFALLDLCKMQLCSVGFELRKEGTEMYRDVRTTEFRCLRHWMVGWRRNFPYETLAVFEYGKE